MRLGLLVNVMVMIVIAKPGFTEEISVEQFIDIYAPHALAIQSFYETTAATTTIAEMRYEVSGVDGNWVSAVYELDGVEPTLIVLKCEEGTVEIRRKNGKWTPLGVFPSDRRPPLGVGGATFLDAYCWNSVPFITLLNDGWPFTKIVKKGNMYALHWEHENPGGGKKWGVRTLDSLRSFVCVKQSGGFVDEATSTSVSGESEYHYANSGTTTVPLMTKVTFSVKQPDGSVVKGVEEIALRPNQPADRDHLTLAHYGLSDNLWKSRTAPTAPWWDSIPSWVILVLIGGVFFGFAAAIRRREANK